VNYAPEGQRVQQLPKAVETKTPNLLAD
jgi:hypothetical protein